MILVTGANGFIGSALCVDLARQGLSVRRAVRGPPDTRASDLTVAGDIGPDTDWRAALKDVDVVVHLAARVHVMRDTAVDPLAEYRRVNVEGTRRLARMAGEVGVRRFVFLSSAKVNGESSPRPFLESDPPHPQDAYGTSKWEAEQALMRVAEDKGMEWVILRTPLLYGPGVRANFLRLMRAVDRGVPLPLGAVHNRRSLLYSGNLVDAIRVCLDHPGAANQLFMVTDGEDVSMPELVHRLAAALKVRPRLISMPLPLLHLAGRLTGRTALVDRLTGSMQLDGSLICSKLGWAPPFTLHAALSETVRWYRNR
jgi:nucleoside-diphosphate-sugar epimerase